MSQVQAALLGHAFLSGGIFLSGMMAAFTDDLIIWIPIAVVIWIIMLLPVHTPNGEEE